MYCILQQYTYSLLNTLIIKRRNKTLIRRASLLNKRILNAEPDRLIHQRIVAVTQRA